MAKLAMTKRKVSGGVVAFIGYMLSPLSWWNDAFVNVPLALVFAWTVGLFCRFSKPGFEATVVLGYWLTNVAGFVLMQKGGAKILSEKDKAYSWRSLARDVAVSLLYTLLIVALVQWGVLQPLRAQPRNDAAPAAQKASQT
jgi:hypothetical protein